MAATNPPDDVQFLDDADDADEETDAADPAAARYRRLPGAAVIPFVLALAGVVLAVVAPFHSAYRLRLPSFDGASVTLAPDGWGRASSTVIADNGQHGPRIGVVLCAAAAIALVGLVLWLLPSRRIPRAAGGIAITLAAGASLAGAATVVLIGSATADSYRAALRANGANFRADDVTVSFSWTVWLAAASGVLMLAAVVVRAVLPTERQNAPEPQATERTATSTERDASMEPLL